MNRCQDCGRSYVEWNTPHEFWNRVMGGLAATDDPGGMLCASCFLERAEQVGLSFPAWRVTGWTPS